MDSLGKENSISAAKTDLPVVIDIEASGFGRGSYPIEIGLALADGSPHCFLIRPLPHWSHWSREAEDIHGIDRDTLLQHGRPAPWVAEQLNRLLAGQTAYTDAWGNDNSWLGRLYEEVGLGQRYRLETIRRLLSETQAAAWGETRETLRWRLKARRHRASSDALVLQKTYQELCSLGSLPDQLPAPSGLNQS